MGRIDLISGSVFAYSPLRDSKLLICARSPLNCCVLINREAHQGIFERILTKAIILLKSDNLFFTFMGTEQHIEESQS